MKEVNLDNYQIRTDLVTDLENIDIKEGISEEAYEENSIKVSNITIDKYGEKMVNKKSGFYTTIYFEDITDEDNFEKVEKITIKELNKMLEKSNITSSDSCLIIGLGNDKVTPDSLGPRSLDDIITTKHIFDLTNQLEDGFRITSKLSPGVMGETGIETIDIITSITSVVEPSFLIVIDALASSSVARLTKTIQITNTGISPGSGIGNKRCEISKEKLNIPVIAIGIPMVVDAVTICYDTMDYMLKHFSYNFTNDIKNKIIPFSQQNYLLKENRGLTDREKTFFLGAFGTLSNQDKKDLIRDVLTPIGYNLMVTTKEVDFLIDKLSKLISSSINKVLHHK